MACSNIVALSSAVVCLFCWAQVKEQETSHAVQASGTHSVLMLM